MPSILLACAAVSLLLLGCKDVERHQERAADAVESAAENIRTGMQKAREVKAQAENRAKQLEEGYQDVKSALEKGKEGVEDIRGALSVSHE